MGELPGKGLEEALKKMDEKYYDYYCDIKDRRESEYASRNQKGIAPTSHGPIHIKHVKEKLYELMGEEAIGQLSALELYTLLCAIELHDIGIAMVEQIEKHSEASAKHVESKTDWNWLDSEIRFIIADVIRSHGMENFEEFLNKKYKDGYSECIHDEYIHVGVLMALLRIGDILDWTYERANEDIRDKAPVIGESFFYWYRHVPIKEIEPNRKGKKIRITGREFGKYNCRVLEDEKKYLMTNWNMINSN